MADSNQQQDQVKPSEQRGGAALHDKEAGEKGRWAGTADEGIVPAELGGSDAPREMLADDPQLGSSVLGMTTGSDKPATGTGIARSGDDKADAATVAAAREGERLLAGYLLRRSADRIGSSPFMIIVCTAKLSAVMRYMRSPTFCRPWKASERRCRCA